VRLGAPGEQEQVIQRDNPRAEGDHVEHSPDALAMARSLVDTNILICSRDLNEPVERATAIDLIDRLGASGELVLSVQCLNEFSSVSLRRGTPIVEVRAAVSVWHDLGDVSADRCGDHRSPDRCGATPLVVRRRDLGHRARRGCTRCSF
jgi:hypothetical protein